MNVQLLWTPGRSDGRQNEILRLASRALHQLGAQNLKIASRSVVSRLKICATPLFDGGEFGVVEFAGLALEIGENQLP